MYSRKNFFCYTESLFVRYKETVPKMKYNVSFHTGILSVSVANYEKWEEIRYAGFL